MKKNYIFLLFLLLIAPIAFAQDMNSLVSNYFNKTAKTSNLTTANLSKEDLSEWKITDVVPSIKPGIQHVYVQQYHKGIPIDNGRYKLTVQKDQVTWEINQFIDNMALKANSLKGSMSPENAILKVVREHQLKTPRNLRAVSSGKNAFKYTNTGMSIEPITADKVYLYHEQELYLTWKVNIYQEDGQHWWVSNVDIASGKILRTEDWVITCNYDDSNEKNHNHSKATPNVKTSTSALDNINMDAVGGGTYNVFPLGVESPIHGDRTIVNDPANATASPFGWHDTNGNAGAEFTTTRGNNVLAQDDINGNNGSGATPNGGSNLDFNFPLNLNAQPSQSLDAATTNLFYWNNIMHDVWYQYGFNEASGNFQENNYGNGGAGSDSVNADSQDGSGTNNANFSTPPDGSNPRMQMFLFNGSPQIDGDYDNLVIAHEYGHGISTRLVGGPGTNALGGSEQMGEGWSDWFGLILTIEPGDTGATPRGVGSYVVGQGPNGGGIRPTHYSTDTAVNNSDYADVPNLVVPHGVGYGFATILWDMTWALIDQEGYDSDLYNGTGGNNIAMALVIEGLKNTANNPGYVSGRDGILQADQDLYGGQFNCLIWTAFSARGVGLDAVENSNGGANSNSDQVVSFVNGCNSTPPPGGEDSSCNATVSSLPYSESFENTLGQWTQETTDDFNWSLRTGGTPSNSTGPNGAFDGTHYIYVEASDPNFGGLTTILNSPCFNLTGTNDPQVTFYYQMTGNAVGTIRLEARRDNEATWAEIWSQNGDQGADWISQTVDLSSYEGGTVQLRYRATTANSWQGDIAIDAFGISEGAAPPQGDTQAPTTPADLSITGITDTTADISWNASTDNVGVTSYNVYLDGVLLGSATGTSAQITGLAPGTTYDFTVEAVDAAANVSNLSNVATGTTTGGSSGPLSDVLLGSFFETGLDGWIDGGSDCFRYRGNLSSEGSFSMRLRDNSGSRSSMTTAASYDLTPYDNVEISFSFYARSMENGEDFFVLYDDGSGFSNIATFVSGTDFNNDSFLTATVNLPSNAFNLSSNGRFRIQCDASSNGDQVYIDEVVITGTAGSSATAGLASKSSAIGSSSIQLSFNSKSISPTENIEGDFKIFPNPTASYADIRLSIDIEDRPIDMELRVYDISGKMVMQKSYDGMINEQFSERLNVSDLDTGIYFVRITSSNGMLETYKLVKD